MASCACICCFRSIIGRDIAGFKEHLLRFIYAMPLVSVGFWELLCFNVGFWCINMGYWVHVLQYGVLGALVWGTGCFSMGNWVLQYGVLCFNMGFWVGMLVARPSGHVLLFPLQISLVTNLLKVLCFECVPYQGLSE